MIPEGLLGLTLRVRDPDPMSSFYEGLLGLSLREGDREERTFATGEGGFELRLRSDPAAPVRGAFCIGLYHFALLLPDREALAAVVRRIVESGYPLDGASDHTVSEAVYLRDPEGNGIELYRDRPREGWPRFGDGQVSMTTGALDLRELIDEAVPAVLHAGTRFGHIHLHTSDLEESGAFYEGSVGLEVTLRGYPGALFLSSGGYHHHVGLNTWARDRRAPDGATGLLSYTWRVRGLDSPTSLRDPDGVEIRLLPI